MSYNYKSIVFNKNLLLKTNQYSSTYYGTYMEKYCEKRNLSLNLSNLIVILTKLSGPASLPNSLLTLG